MEQNPIYQGTQYVAANTATSDANVPRKLLFAEEWERNRHATTQALQGIEQALIERNDNTVLLNQQAEAKRRDLEMTMEMKNILDLENGAEGSWYDYNGKLNKQAVRDFIKKYSTMPTQWGKAVRSPEAQQKSASMSQAYQIGVQEAVEAAILANTKKREQQAYKDNMRLATEMKDWNERDRITDAAEANGALSPAEAATEKIISERGRLAQEIDECDTTDKLLDKWYDPDFQQRISNPAFSELKEAMQKKIEHDNSTQATTTGDYYELDPKTGKRKAVAGTVTPPDGAPWYIQTVMRQYNGKVPADIASAAIQKYLGEQVDELNSTTKGRQQWSRARAMAHTLGLDDTAFNNEYKMRSSQLQLGGFDAPAILKNIADEHWLYTTRDDEALIERYASEGKTLTEEDKKAKLARIAQERRDIILNEYNNWYKQATSEGNVKPTPRQQYATLLEIIRRRGEDWEEITPYIRENTALYLKREIEVAKEQGRTQARKRKTAELTKDFNEKNPMPTYWQTSTDVKFSYDLAPTDGGTLPDSKTHNIIYLPKDMELPAKSANVSIKDGKLGFTIEFRHADVGMPTPSRKLLRSMGRPTFSPASISWDGYGLDVANAEALPDNGLAPDEESIIPDGPDPHANDNRQLPL